MVEEFNAWKRFVQDLKTLNDRARNPYIRGEKNSYLHTIAKGREIVRRDDMGTSGQRNWRSSPKTSTGMAKTMAIWEHSAALRRLTSESKAFGNRSANVLIRSLKFPMTREFRPSLRKKS